MIDHKTIQQVYDRADIVEVIGKYITLTGSGNTLKGLCPFHEEKTPSFVVTRSLNKWHCFGCGKGGDVVSFIMEKEGYSYPEAIKFLAKMYNIEVIEQTKTYTAEEKRIFDKREALFIITKAAADFYAAQLYKNNADCKAAKDYVYRRWSKDNKDINTADELVDFPRMLGIGYAQGKDSFYQFAKDLYPVELMKEIGLVAEDKYHNIYDVYADRIVIPIRDRYKNVTGFTCRTMKDDKRISKYINSYTSVIFEKRKTLFGIDVAVRQAILDGCFYCVEGAPDVLKLQLLGVTNTVATLGTEWSDYQFEKLKRYNLTLCFIPDADLPKGLEKYGPGTISVMKNGRNALLKGFKVTVKQIPLSDKKQDADSFFKSKNDVYELKNEDFIIWYARNAISPETDTTSERSEKILDICYLLAHIADENEREALLARLGDMFGNKSIWKKSLKTKLAEIQRSKAERVSQAAAIDTLKEYGFTIMNNCYMGNNLQTKWSNFVLNPLFHIKDPFNSKRLYEMINVAGKKEIIELTAEELISLPKFMQRVESLGNFLFFGTMDDLKKVKMYLYDSTETAVEIKQLGWNPAGFFAWGNGIYYNNKFYNVDDNGIVHLDMTDSEGKATQENYYLPAMSTMYDKEIGLFTFEKKFIFNDTHSLISMPKFCCMMAQVFGTNAKIAIEFLLATLFKDIVVAKTTNFPILNLFGPKGSGKSELAHTIMSYFIRKDTGINIQNATIAALSDSIAQCANALVHIDEYKNNLMPDKVEFLKGLYDGTGRTRMNMDQGKRQTTKVDSAVVLSGQEMPTIDIALFSRTIFLTFENTTHTAEEKEKFNELKAICTLGVSHLTNEILKYRNVLALKFNDTYEEVLKELQRSLKGNIEDRIWRNWGMLLAIYSILSEPLKLPWSYEEMKKHTIDGIMRQNKECVVGNELGEFFDALENMVAGGNIYENADFKIKDMDELKTDIVDRKFQESKTVLMIRPKYILLQYRMTMKKAGKEPLPERTIKYYLCTSPAYLGKKGTERFKTIVNGEVQKVNKGTYTMPKWVDYETYDHPLCFDYEMLKDMYDLNIVKLEGITEDNKDDMKDNTTDNNKEYKQGKLPIQ